MKFVESARQDLHSIYSWNFHYWGVTQADLYHTFLLEICVALESGERVGNDIATNVESHYYLAKGKRAKHGHRIIYRFEQDELVVLRILHSAMEFPRYFSD